MATGVKIPDLEDSINSYIEEITAYLKDNSLLTSSQKSSVRLFSPDPHQAKTNPRILIEVLCPNILGVYLDHSLLFNKHNGYIAERVSSRNNILKAMAGTSGNIEGDITDGLQGSWEIGHQLCCICLEYATETSNIHRRL